MNRKSLLIGSSALGVCICTAAVLITVALTPAADTPNPDFGQTPYLSSAGLTPSPQAPPTSTEAISGKPFEGTTEAEATGSTEPTQSPEPTEPPDEPTFGGTLQVPAPMDLNPTSITLLVNRDYKLTEEHVPDDLVVPDVRFTFAYYDTKKLMRQEAADALEELFAAGEAEGIVLYGVSAYRSYNRQYTIYATNLITRGVRHTNQYSAAPGASEHQTGLAIDVSSESAGFSLEEVFGTTKEGIWLAENAHHFGFIIRYPKGLEEITGYAYEPWHIRYVGIELASYLYESGLTLDEYYGYEPIVAFASLADTPLIDTESDRYVSLYHSLFPPSTPTPDEPGSDEESSDTSGSSDSTQGPDTELPSESEDPSDAESSSEELKAPEPESSSENLEEDETEPSSESLEEDETEPSSESLEEDETEPSLYPDEETLV